MRILATWVGPNQIREGSLTKRELFFCTFERTQKVGFDYCGQVNMRCSCFGASIAERKRKSGSGSGQFGHDLDENVLENIKAFSYNELRSAMDNFHMSNKIGAVYKAKNCGKRVYCG